MTAKPSIESAVTLSAALGNKIVHLNCVSCKKILWEVKVNMTSEKVVSTETTAFPGVKNYEDVWQKKWNDETKQQEWVCKDTKCPFCLRDHFQAIIAHGKRFARPHSVEMD